MSFIYWYSYSNRDILINIFNYEESAKQRCENDFSVWVYKELHSQIYNIHMQPLKVCSSFHIPCNSERKYYSYHSIVQSLEFIDIFFSCPIYSTKAYLSTKIS